MQDKLRVARFRQEGPSINGLPLLEKTNGTFAYVNSVCALDSGVRTALEKIVAALNRQNFAEAAIRFTHIEDLIKIQVATTLTKANFDPSQPRDTNGEWSQVSGTRVATTDSDGTPSVGYCKIVKQFCIVEATDTLPTGDYGFKFFRALNACMDRHGCLGVA